MMKIFGGQKFRHKFIFVFLIFVSGWNNENILRPKISRFMVHVCICMYICMYVRTCMYVDCHIFFINYELRIQYKKETKEGKEVKIKFNVR